VYTNARELSHGTADHLDLLGQESVRRVSDICWEHGVSEKAFCRWMSKFGTVADSEAKRLWASEQKSAELKKIVAKQSLDNRTLETALRRSAGVLSASRGSQDDAAARCVRAPGLHPDGARPHHPPGPAASKRDRPVEDAPRSEAMARHV
jgi:putative transposase